MNDRHEELRSGLAAVRHRIAAAAGAAGRDPQELTLVVVTKTYPADDVRLLRDLGVREVGESRHQEAAPKAQAMPDLHWHFIGRLQSNKARAIAAYADVVHSLDSASSLRALAAGAVAAGRTVDCFVQVSLDGDRSRGGVPIEELLPFADQVAAAEGLRLLGPMAVAPLGEPPDGAFGRLAEAADRLRKVHTGARSVSAGMSGDLEEAIRHGATHLRVGSAILGNRPPPR